jgi:hypothetical protein
MCDLEKGSYDFVDLVPSPATKGLAAWWLRFLPAVSCNDSTSSAAEKQRHDVQQKEGGQGFSLRPSMLNSLKNPNQALGSAFVLYTFKERARMNGWQVICSGGDEDP